MSEELNENEEVSEIDTEEQERLEREEQERLQREQEERERAEEEAREQARIEHENFLKSFPDTTVFYDRIFEEENVKRLGAWIKDPYVAERLKMLDNHMDESELSWCINPKTKSYAWYLKGYEDSEPTVEELQLDRYHLIDSQIEAYLDARVKEHNYKSVESCVSYYNSTDEKYRSEARAVSEWRDHIYHTGEQVWQSVLNGLVDYKDVDLDYIISIAGDFTWEINV